MRKLFRHRPTAAVKTILFAIAFSFFLSVLTVTGMAQDTAADMERPEVDISADALLDAKDQVEKNTNLSREQRETLVQLYESALRAVESAAAFAGEVDEYERDKVKVGSLIQSLQDPSTRPEGTTDTGLPDSASAEEVQEALLVAEAELAASRTAVAGLRKTAEQRTQRRIEIAKRIGALNQQLIEISERLESAAQIPGDPLLQKATIASLLGSRLSAQREQESLKAENSSYDARAELLPLRQDRARQRRAALTRLVEDLRERAERQTAALAEQYLAELRQRCDEAVVKYPALSDLTAQILDGADQLTGLGGLEERSQAADRKLARLQEVATQVREMMQLTRQKSDAVGLEGDVTQWFPDLPESLPNRRDIRTEIRGYAIQIPDVQYQTILLREKRTREEPLDNQVDAWMAKVNLPDDSDERDELRTLLEDLLRTRREQTDGIIVAWSGYLSTLAELESESRALLHEMESSLDYLLERLFWVRSVPGSWVPSPPDTWAAVKWLFASPEWPSSLSRSLGAVKRHKRDALLGLALLALLIAGRPFLRRRISALAASASQEDNYSIRPTVEAFAITALQSAPLPLALFLVSQFISRPAPAAAAFGFGNALFAISVFCFALSYLVEFFQPNGLAEAHFDWSADSGRDIRRKLKRFMVLFLPPGFVSLAFGWEILDFVGTPEDIAFTNSLGRLAFLALTIVTAWMLNQIRKPGGNIMAPTIRAVASEKGKWIIRYASSAMLAVTILGAFLAVIGYYLSGFILVWRMFEVLLLGVFLSLGTQLILRWMDLRTRRRLAVQAQEQPAESAGNTLAAAGRSAEIAATKSQVQLLLHFLIAVVFIVWFHTVLAQYVPLLAGLNRIQIWPTIEVLAEPKQDVASVADYQLALGAGTADMPEGNQEEAATGSQLTPGTAVMAPAAGTASRASQSGQGSNIVLGEVVLALFIIAGTIIVWKTLPAFLEITILEQIPMRGGDRKALATIVGYIILFAGLAAAAAQLGLTWSSIQWLAAAFSFGLAFGLQEIFANFVSGLIILFERPMRVGDAVEIGGHSGFVTKVDMRATTISTWNRSELVVPNKEFITGPLINWTLSSSLARVEVAVGVAYGSDVALVRKTLLKVAAAHPAVLSEPAPEVKFMKFGDSSLEFELRVFINYEDGRVAARDTLNSAIDEAFRKNNITIAFPQLDLHLPGRESRQELERTSDSGPKVAGA